MADIEMLTVDKIIELEDTDVPTVSPLLHNSALPLFDLVYVAEPSYWNL